MCIRSRNGWCVTVRSSNHKDDADCKIFLLGAKEGIAAKAMEGVHGSGCYH